MKLERHAALVRCEKQTVGKKEGTVGYTSQTKYLERYTEVWRSRTQRTTHNAQEILPKYEDLFWRQPNVWAVKHRLYSVGENGDIPLEVPDGEGGCKRIVGFIIRVTEKVDQSALPPEDRIPDTIEGVPVQIIEVPEGFNFPAP